MQKSNYFYSFDLLRDAVSSFIQGAKSWDAILWFVLMLTEYCNSRGYLLLNVISAHGWMLALRSSKFLKQRVTNDLLLLKRSILFQC